MLRDKSLIPLSRQHQHALALCVRIERAMPIDDTKVGDWQAEITQQFEAEIKVHFAAEEQILFPAAGAFGELNPLVEDSQITNGCEPVSPRPKRDGVRRKSCWPSRGGFRSMSAKKNGNCLDDYRN